MLEEKAPSKSHSLCAAGFWGGLTPENAVNETALAELLEAGVLGLKVSCFIAYLSDLAWLSTGEVTA
jgi:hypothetical protein